VWIQWKCYVLIYESGQMRPVETILRIGVGGVKENDGRGEYT
jgi:hypothetical protein